MNIIAQAMAGGVLERAREDEREAARKLEFSPMRDDRFFPSIPSWNSEMNYLHACAIVDDLEREA